MHRNQCPELEEVGKMKRLSERAGPVAGLHHYSLVGRRRLRSYRHHPEEPLAELGAVGVCRCSPENWRSQMDYSWLVVVCVLDDLERDCQ